MYDVRFKSRQSSLLGQISFSVKDQRLDSGFAGCWLLVAIYNGPIEAGQQDYKQTYRIYVSSAITSSEACSGPLYLGAKY